MLTEAELNKIRAESARATQRAKAVLKPGDRLTGKFRCGHRVSTRTFSGWDGQWIVSRTAADAHATHILKVNGVLTTFRDPPGFDPQAQHRRPEP